MTDRERVLAAVRMGARTSLEVARYTGITQPRAAAHLSEMARDGRLARRARKAIRYLDADGRRSLPFDEYAVAP